MALTRIRLMNYRCFKDTGDVELRPLTLVLGKNNSGKSALVRAPLVWSTGFRGAPDEPLNLDLVQDLNVADSFIDLVYGRKLHGSTSMALTTEKGIEFSVTVQNIADQRAQLVSSVEMHYQMHSKYHTFFAGWDEDPDARPRAYIVSFDGEERSDVDVRFDGIMPTVLPRTKLPPENLPELPSFGTETIPQIRYIGPFRRQPEFDYRFPRRDLYDVGTAGQNAPAALARNALVAHGGILGQLNQDISSLLPGWEIDVVEEGSRFSIWLSKPAEGLKVNLADAGAGVAQVLPLFVQRALDSGLQPALGLDILEIIEQPELHLHPAAHADLADLYVNAVERQHARFIIETHSETMILRFRRRIAEGRLNADKVALYFVESTGSGSSVRRINIDERGNLDYWPEGVFSEDYRELLGLTAAQDAH